jgi:hypothetical protein
MTGLRYSNRPWPSADLLALRLLMRQRASLKEAAQFLCRNEEEVDVKVAELRLWNERGPILDADPPAQGVKIARRLTPCGLGRKTNRSGEASV